MTTPLRLLCGGLAAIGFATTASAQYPFPCPPRHPVVVPTFSPPPVVVQPPVFVQPPPVVVQRPPVLIPPEPVFAPPQQPVYCLDTFARDFRPCPGRHHILIIHPVTKCPVEVCFTLPDRRLREVEVKRREIEFEYGLGFRKVEIEFKRNGTVEVHGG